MKELIIVIVLGLFPIMIFSHGQVSESEIYFDDEASQQIYDSYLSIVTYINENSDKYISINHSVLEESIETLKNVDRVQIENFQNAVRQGFSGGNGGIQNNWDISTIEEVENKVLASSSEDIFNVAPQIFFDDQGTTSIYSNKAITERYLRNMVHYIVVESQRSEDNFRFPWPICAFFGCASDEQFDINDKLAKDMSSILKNQLKSDNSAVGTFAGQIDENQLRAVLSATQTGAPVHNDEGLSILIDSLNNNEVSVDLIDLYLEQEAGGREPSERSLGNGELLITVDSLQYQIQYSQDMISDLSKLSK